MSILVYTHDGAQSIFSQALSVVKQGGIIAYPTESFYALGVLATDENAVRKLFELKKRPSDKPLPLIICDKDTLFSVAKIIPDQAEQFITKYWPGALTLIFQAQDTVPPMITANTKKVAVRIPGKSLAHDLVCSLKLAITATSANISSTPPAVDAASVQHYFGDRIDLIIDGGTAPGGRPSTIVDVTVTPPDILREGSIILPQ